MMAPSAIYWFVVALVSVVSSQYLDANNCVSGKASFNEKSGACECNPGLVGMGDLCCNVPDDKDVCYMSGDPILTSVKGQKVPLNIPCSVCIAIVESQASNGQKCVLEVLASSAVGKLGAIYTSIIKVGVSINNRLPVYFSFTGDSANIAFPKQPLQTLQPSDIGSSGKALSVEAETILVKYDAAAKIWSMEGCQSSVSFRPHIPGSKLSPGACIQAKKTSIVKTVENGNLCGLSASYDKSVPWAYGVLSDALNTRQVFDPQQSASHPDYTDICRDDIDSVMGEACQGISKDAMEQCGAILYNPAVRTCLDLLGEKGPDLLKLFGFCLDTYCNGDKDSCEEFGTSTAIETCLPSFSECNTWPYYIDEANEEI